MTPAHLGDMDVNFGAFLGKRGGGESAVRPPRWLKRGKRAVKGT